MPGTGVGSYSHRILPWKETIKEEIASLVLNNHRSWLSSALWHFTNVLLWTGCVYSWRNVSDCCVLVFILPIPSPTSDTHNKVAGIEHSGRPTLSYFKTSLSHGDSHNYNSTTWGFKAMNPEITKIFLLK